MLEFERTFLLKKLPFKMDIYPYKELIDHYMPQEFEHPKLRLRKCGDKYEITKKTLINDGDSSVQREQTIEITPKEYLALSKLPNKCIHKYRYLVPYNGLMLEIDVFTDDLDGLFLMDVEFGSKEEMDKFEMPNFCVADVSQEELFAGGMLCGKTYSLIYPLIAHYYGE